MMKQAMQFFFPAIAGIATFSIALLGIEFATWWWASPSDPLADPALNATRFAVSLAIGLGTAFVAFPREARRKDRLTAS